MACLCAVHLVMRSQCTYHQERETKVRSSEEALLSVKEQATESSTKVTINGKHCIQCYTQVFLALSLNAYQLYVLWSTKTSA